MKGFILGCIFTTAFVAGVANATSVKVHWTKGERWIQVGAAVLDFNAGDGESYDVIP